MHTYTGRADGVAEDGAALLLLLLKIPEARRTPTQARLYDVFLEQYARNDEYAQGAGDVMADVQAIGQAVADFYAMPERELRQSLQGWSPVPSRPTLAAILNGMGWRRRGRVLTVEADS